MIKIILKSIPVLILSHQICATNLYVKNIDVDFEENEISLTEFFSKKRSIYVNGYLKDYLACKQSIGSIKIGETKRMDIHDIEMALFSLRDPKNAEKVVSCTGPYYMYDGSYFKSISVELRLDEENGIKCKITGISPY